MEHYRQDVQQKYSHYQTGRHMIFPTPPTAEKNVHDVVNTVKDIITSLASEATTEVETTTLEIPTTTNLLEVLSTSSDVLNNSNSTIFETSTDSGNVLEILNNNSTIMEVVNNTAIEIASGDNSTVLEIFNGDNSTMLTSTEKANTTFDWMSDGVKYNLTLVHGAVPEKEADDQTLFIILGAMLGVMVAISFILLLIYVSYKRSNRYTLQERASSDQSRRDISLQVSSGDHEDSQLTDDKSGYKF